MEFDLLKVAPKISSKFDTTHIDEYELHWPVVHSENNIQIYTISLVTRDI
jgi:diketogulonate reductase-like aldo/keto reductase